MHQAAVNILTANDRGGFTIPTSRLYPYQWNWDSAFAALGFARFDRRRAWTEIEMLFAAQWDNGMVPHIIFRSNDPDYFPGPDIWQSGTEPASSGHSQPPVATSVVRWLLQNNAPQDRDHALHLFPSMLAYHRWFHAHRDPDNTGLVATIHPWESGRDNCPDWDSGLNGMDVDPDLGDYVRRDTSHVDASERPNQFQYDRFLTIIKFGRECQWDSKQLYRKGPFLMVDPGIQFILLRADRDLLAMAKEFDRPETELQEISTWIERSSAASEKLWNSQARAYCALDLRSGHMSDAMTSASMLALYAKAGTDEHRNQLMERAGEILHEVKYAFPSWDPTHAKFEAKRYWRGPVWAIMNYMIARGLEEHENISMAQRVQEDTRKLITQSGYFEYFDPLTGEGCGGDDFTWTAAVQLAIESH